MHIPNGEVKYIRHPRGLHYLNLNKTSNAHMLMAMTIKENIEGYIKWAVDGAIKARCLQGMMRHPSQCDFANLVHDRLVQNYLITINDVTNAYNIFVPYLAGLRGKTVRKNQITYTQILGSTKVGYQKNKLITLTANIMFINGIPFLITYGRGVGLIKVEWIPNRTKNKLALNITKVLQLYTCGGFTVQTLLMDMDFEKLGTSSPWSM